MGTSRISLSLFSVLLTLSVLWTPAYSNDKCDLSCKGSSSGATFLSGHTYNYAVDGTVSIFLTGAVKKETAVSIVGQVSISADGNCALSLKVNSLAIAGPDGKKYPAPKGIEKVVRFNLQDGRVGPEICTEEGDNRSSLNIKRAIISLLQTEQKPSTQTDVFGSCPTDVSSSKEGGSVLVHRSRDLSSCAYREQTKNELVTAVYNPNAEIKSTQLLQSTLNVESKVNNGVPEKVSAVEQYLYKPFSVGDSGARAEVNTKLILTGTTKAGGNGGACNVARTIIFENPHKDKAANSDAKNVLNAIKETCKTLGSEAGLKSAGTFAQLVRIFRTANKNDLLQVFEQIKSNSLEKRVFLDGLLRAGTGHSIEASIQILKSKGLSALEEKVVYLSLGNARHVTSDAIKAAAGLLDLPNLPNGVYLGVGALAGVYCRDHNCHTERTGGITELSNKLAAKLQNCKPKTKIEEDIVVAVLKGIRNIRHLENNLVDKLASCAADNNVKARVRVNALEAFHADPCAAKIKKTALEIMKNRNLDSEIRIKAYLAVIDCPCGRSANEIKHLLESEPIHQVGRFITTSLRHIRSSANPDKNLARQHYGLIGIPNKYNIDDRKYSFYRELSYNVDAIGAGGNLEQTIIYSQDSFLPRSASLNLTVEVFGHNVNILEVGGRQGNLDRVVEHFLGPRSFLRTQKPEEILNNFVQKFQESYHKVEGSVRGRRSIKSEVDNFDKHVKAESIQYNNELDLDIYIKLFGTDAVFLSLGDNKGFDFNKFLDQSLSFMNEGFNKMKHFQQELRGHYLFMDTELAYPTSTGLPLKLDAVGSVTGRVGVSSAVDIRHCLRNPESAKVDIKLIPSSDVEISLIMLVDADLVSTGLKVITNLHSSTGGHVIAKVIENGKGFDLQWGLPIEKQEILTASSDLVFFTAESGQFEKQTPITNNGEKKEYSGCFDQLSGVLGLTLCGEVSLSEFPGAFPLFGSSKVKLVLEKNDLKGYHIKGVIRNDPNGKYALGLLLDAEGAKNRRTQINAGAIYNSDEKSIELEVESPIKNIHAKYAILTKSSEYALVTLMKFDQNKYYGRIGLNIEGNHQRSVWKPVIEYEMPGQNEKKSLKVDGQIVKETNGPSTKYTLENVKIFLSDQNEMNIEGHLYQEPKGVEMDLKGRLGTQNVLLSGSLKGYDAKLEFQNTLNPYVNFKINGHFENAEGINHNDIDLYYSGDLRDQHNRVIFNQLYKRHQSADGFNVITKNKFEICALPIRAQLDLEMDPKKFDIELGGVYLDKKANFDLEARTHIKKDGDYRVKLTLNVDKHIVEALVKRDIVSSDKSNLENYIEFKNFFKYELSGVVLHRIKTNDVNIGAVGHLKITGNGKAEDIKFDVGAIETAHLYSSHATISSTKGELLDFLLKINIGNNANGQLKFNLKDAITANGQYQVADKDGKGNGNIIVHFKKVERIIKGDVKFIVKAPVYNADIDLYLNFDKNKDDKLHFSTSNKFNDKVTNSKNKFVYSGKAFELNLLKEGVIYGVGKGRNNLEVVLPDQRCITLKGEREVTSKDDVLNGHAEILLSDSPKRGQAGSSIKYKGKIVDTDFSKFHVDYDGQVEMTLKEGKNLVNTFSFKNIPKGEKYDVAFKDEISGNLLPNKVIIDASGVYTTDVSNTDDTYRVKASYGDDLAAELTAIYQILLPESGEKKLLEDITLNVRLPFEKAHDLKWVSTFQYLQPENKAVEVTLIEVFQVNADLYKLESSGKYGLKNGNTKIKFIVPHCDPIILDSDYKVNESKDKKTGEVELKAQYGKGKTSTFKLHGASAPKDLELKFDFYSPDWDIAKKLELNLRAKSPSPDTYNSLISIDVDGRAYKSEGFVVYSNTQPVVDLKYSSSSNPKTSRIYFKGISIRSKEGRIDMKVENIKDFNLDSTLEANLEKDLYVKFQGNSEKLGLKNYKLDISSKDAGSGKRLEFHAINDNKNVLSGSTSYISKQEGQKTIIEGSGTVKIKDEQKPANFKYIRTILTEGNEQGIETFINLAFGDRNHVVETRITNVEYKTSYVYCEEKKQCAHAELNSKFVTAPDALKHLFNVGLDLRKLGLATEFGLQVANEFSDKKMPQYDLNLHVNRESDKYHFHVYSQPENGKFPAGIVLSFPKRVIAVESLIQYPTDKNLPFPVRGELSLYPDKNKPQTKTAARFSFDVNGNEKQGEATALIGFSHPRLGKEALVKFHGSMKRPAVNTLKIETSSIVSHSILGNDREAKFYLEVNPVHIKLLLDTPLVQVIDLEGSATVKENLQQADLKFSLLQGKPVKVYAVVKDFEYYEFTTGYSDESERKLSVISHLNPEKRVDVSVDIVLPEQKKNIVHGALFLQDNLIKSDYGVSQDNFNHFVGALKRDLETLKLRIQGIGDKASADFKKILQKVEPTYKQIEKTYKEDVEKMIKEIGNDKSLKEISELLHTIVKIAAKIVDDFVTVFKPMADKIVETITGICNKIADIYDKQIEPQFKQLYSAVAAVFEEYLNGIIDAVAHFSAIIIDFFERHKPELQELANVFTEIFKDLNRIVVAQLKEWRAKSYQFFSELTQQIKEMPILGMIKEKWHELEIPVKAMSLLQGVHATVRPILPTEETKQFLDALLHYAEKKITNKPCDETAELRIIFEKLVSAVTSLANFVRAQLGQVGLQQYIDVTETRLLGASPITLPSFRGSVALSFISQVLRGDIPDPLTLVKTYRPRSLNPLDEIPSKMRAVIVNGQHIFTFDGRHLTFPGSCRYVLAHDHVDRNFTLVIQLANGNPKALILEDKSGTTIELKENGQVALNGASHGYPVSEKEVFAFKQPNGRISVGSLYGLRATCTGKLEVCYVEVSGFYLGKLRGLLGDGNNEPYDDFRLPNGKITSSESDFGNAYKLAGSCPAVKTPEHSHHQMHEALPPACDEVFGRLSPLRPLSLVLDIAPFRQACIHASSGASEPMTQACDLGRAYAALAVTGLLPATLPAACVRCSDAGPPRELGAIYDVKLPDKQADIIVSVELTKSNEDNFRDIVVPLVSQVIDSLKAKHITDIKVYLVGITSKMPYPILYDTDLKLKSAKVQFEDASRYDDIKPVHTWLHNEYIAVIADQFVSYLNFIKNRLGLTNVMATYQSILDLPLRPTAVKHYISSVGDKCVPQDLVLSILRSEVYQEVFKNLDLTHTLIANTPNLKIGGGKSVNQVVGFSEHSVLLLGDKKQKDTETLRESLKLENEDSCIDLAQNSGGFTFSASTFRTCNAGQQKQWLQTAAASVTARLTQHSLVQTCTCSFVDPFRVRSVCVTKERKEAARRRK